MTRCMGLTAPAPSQVGGGFEKTEADAEINVSEYASIRNQKGYSCKNASSDDFHSCAGLPGSKSYRFPEKPMKQTTYRRPFCPRRGAER